MRLLADESVYQPIIAALRLAGYDVEAVAEDAPGIDDPGVLARARSSQRVLVTFDLGFGDLIFARGLPAPPGIVLIRLPGQWRWLAMADRVVEVLANEREISRSFVVIGERDVRVRRL